ncbi:transglutaminase-like domain-containing protein [Aestuariivivens insulae]|uniref:transglutaminase-like domain-containing protein n=1 Tax=Aestuariivivens insulae TaxID=1621988 RepID=UPI001F57A1CA|nr:transglutaminase-like domain-containing protein [Aestuariivivens insulae]
MVVKKVLWTLKRHPFLYVTRFRLLSRNSNAEAIKHCTYNSANSKQDIPSYFYKINALIFKDRNPETDLDCVKQLCIWLRTHIKGGAGLSEPSETALRKMLNGRVGVCSDIAQVFNNFCVINDIQVREWGVIRAPFDKCFGGHSFNEVFIKELGQWVLIDVSRCIMFYSEDDLPLSVIGVYRLLRAHKPVRFEYFSSIRLVAPHAIENSFFNPKTVPFLICDYSNKTYDAFLRRFKPFLPIFTIHFLLYILNRSYHYRFPLDNYKRIFA